MTGSPAPQRARTRAAELSDIFRSSHSSRHATKDPRSVGVPDTPPEEKHKSRRSMLPFLGRKKTERLAPSLALPRKSTNTPSGSLGNGSSSLTVASTTDLSITPPSLGSKLAAHFTPLRSPTKTLKARYSSSYKSIHPSHSSTTLSPFPFDGRDPSLESRGSSIQSRATTPRPLCQPSVEHSPRSGVEEDFSDLFVPPKQIKHVPKACNLTPIIVKATDDSKKSTELGPVTPSIPASPSPPSTPCLQFPIPPSNYGLISPSSNKVFPDRSRESSRGVNATPSSKHSDSSLKLPATSSQRSSVSHEHSRHRGTRTDTHDRGRTFSLSGSDTDASRATDSSVCSRGSKHRSVLPRASALKRPAPLQRTPSSSEKLSNGPPSVPLPFPPSSVASQGGPPIGSSQATTPITSVPSRPSGRPMPRPRANTVSAASTLNSSKLAAWMSPKPTTQDSRMNTDILPTASADELRNALALQGRKYSQLQEYAVTITKKFEDEKASMEKTIQMLEREVRKKVREIEGLRWLVIHNGGADDIDAAASLARASLVTLDDGDRAESFRAMDLSQSTTTNPHSASSERDAGSVALSLLCRRTLGPDSPDHPGGSPASLDPHSPEFGLSASSSRSSLSSPILTPLTPSSLSVIPEQPTGKGEISRAERQKAKEERRVARTSRRVSLSSPPLPSEPTSDPQHGMYNVLEKLRPL